MARATPALAHISASRSTTVLKRGCYFYCSSAPQHKSNTARRNPRAAAHGLTPLLECVFDHAHEDRKMEHTASILPTLLHRMAIDGAAVRLRGCILTTLSSAFRRCWRWAPCSRRTRCISSFGGAGHDGDVMYMATGPIELKQLIEWCGAALHMLGSIFQLGSLPWQSPSGRPI